jgi:hypothetical protein
MEKLGMSFVKTGSFYEQTLVQYALTREEFSTQRRRVAKDANDF